MTQAPVAPAPGGAHTHGPGGAPEADRSERFTSFDPAAFAVPHGREEDWRFTPLARLRGLHDDTFVPGGSLAVEVSATPGVTATTARRGDPRLGSVGVPVDRVGANAWANFDEATVITVTEEASPEAPAFVRLTGQGAERAAFGHLFVDVSPFARATLVLDQQGSATYADNLEVRLGDGAGLTLVCLEDWADDTVHLSGQHVEVGRDASFTQIVVTLGGDLVRLAPVVTFGGPGGAAELHGLFFTDPGQHHEHRLFVDHGPPHCRSHVNYKGALQGEGAHAVWIGDVLIRASAIGTETYEINRNLLLTDGPRADSVPNLEIETGDVTSAGHASATGRFDDDQLFYLMSRGVSELDAKRLVVRGFFADIAARVAVPEVRQRLTDAIERELAEGVTG